MKVRKVLELPTISRISDLNQLKTHHLKKFHHGIFFFFFFFFYRFLSLTFVFFSSPMSKYPCAVVDNGDHWVNAVGRVVPKEIPGYGKTIPYAGAFATKPKDRMKITLGLIDCAWHT